MRKRMLAAGACGGNDDNLYDRMCKGGKNRSGSRATGEQEFNAVDNVAAIGNQKRRRNFRRKQWSFESF